MTIPSHKISNSKINQFGDMETDQSNNSNPPKKHPQLGNPSTGPPHPEGLGYVAASPGSSKSSLVPSKTPLDLQVHCHQDLAYVLGWEHTF